MRKQVLIAAVLIACCAPAWAQTEATYFSKQEIEQIIVREYNNKFYVMVFLKEKKGDFQGFYFYEHASLLEAATFGENFRRGRYKGVEHYQEGTGKTMTWGGKRMAVITRWYCMNP